MWIFRVFALSLLAGAFCFGVRAQACGRYAITIKVTDEQGKPVKNASVKLSPIEKDETRGQNFVPDKADPALFSISYPEGYSFSAFHKLTVAAPGFKKAENTGRFTSCEKRSVSVRLVRLKSASEAVWKFENNINIQVFGSDGKYLDDVKMTIIDDKKNSESEDLKFGSAYHYLPNGVYNFRFEKPGFETSQIEVDLTALAGKYLKVELKPKAQ
jgi:hypothetical protein